MKEGTEISMNPRKIKEIRFEMDAVVTSSAKNTPDRSKSK
jgi:hypothetical protein